MNFTEIVRGNVEVVGVVGVHDDLLDLLRAVRAWRESWRGIEQNAMEDEVAIIDAWDQMTARTTT